MPLVSENMYFFQIKKSQGGTVTAPTYDSGTPTVLTL